MDCRVKPGNDGTQLKSSSPAMTAAAAAPLLDAELADLVENSRFELLGEREVGAAVGRLALAALDQAPADQRRRIVVVQLERLVEIGAGLVEIVLEHEHPAAIDIALGAVGLHLDDLIVIGDGEVVFLALPVEI